MFYVIFSIFILIIIKSRGKDEISVIYYRHGYQPFHFTDENTWKVKEILELSNAIKCPSVEFQLINFKKIQEVLQRKNILEK